MAAAGAAQPTTRPPPARSTRPPFELALTEWEHTHARPTLERAQSGKWDQLRAVLTRLADSHHAAQGGGLTRVEQRDLLGLTLDRLARATKLARQLRTALETTPGGEPQ